MRRGVVPRVSPERERPGREVPARGVRWCPVLAAVRARDLRLCPGLAGGVRIALAMAGEGFEPSKAEPPDLQSGPFDRSGTPPDARRGERRQRVATAAPPGRAGAATASDQKRVLRRRLGPPAPRAATRASSACGS